MFICQRVKVKLSLQKFTSCDSCFIRFHKESIFISQNSENFWACIFGVMNFLIGSAQSLQTLRTQKLPSITNSWGFKVGIACTIFTYHRQLLTCPVIHRIFGISVRVHVRGTRVLAGNKCTISRWGKRHYLQS